MQNYLYINSIQFLININNVIILLLVLVYTHQHIYALIAIFFKRRKYPDSKKNYKYGFLIAARNEELVIEHLIDSIKKQNYDLNLLKIFVIADNSSDETYNIALESGAICYKRFNDQLIGKSYALSVLIDNITKDGLNKDIDAYFVFDADNLLDANYVFEMNKLYNAGVEIATSFRDTKNYDSSWVSACSAIAFHRECRIVHYSRNLLNIGTYVSGTGFMISKRIIDENNGWHYHLMVEDIELSIDQALKNNKVHYCEEAIFYDEQPTTLLESCNQRLRWCKGTHQCFLNYNSKLIKRIFSQFKLTCLDLFIHVIPLPLIAFTWMIFFDIIFILLALTSNDTIYYLRIAFGATYNLFLVTFIVGFVHALITIILLRKRRRVKWYKQIFYAILFPVYMFFFIPLSFIATYKKVKWKTIKHTESKKIEDM